MLVLKRKPGESIFVGEAEVFLLQDKRGQFYLGVQADRSIPVHRKEVMDRIRAEAAAECPPVPAEAAG